MKKAVFCIFTLIAVFVFFCACGAEEDGKSIIGYSGVLENCNKIEVRDKSKNKIVKTFNSKEDIKNFVNKIQIDDWQVAKEKGKGHKKEDIGAGKGNERYNYEYIFLYDKYEASLSVYKDRPLVRFRSVDARIHFIVPEDVYTYLNNI